MSEKWASLGAAACHLVASKHSSHLTPQQDEASHQQVSKPTSPRKSEGSYCIQGTLKPIYSLWACLMIKWAGNVKHISKTAKKMTVPKHILDIWNIDRAQFKIHNRTISQWAHYKYTESSWPIQHTLARPHSTLAPSWSPGSLEAVAPSHYLASLKKTLLHTVNARKKKIKIQNVKHSFYANESLQPSHKVERL